MRNLLREIFVRVVGPLHGLFMRALANGPWGPFHPVIIRIFQKCFGIHWPDISGFKNLGDFFLRDVAYSVSNQNLVSPVEALCVEGPAPLNIQEKISVKGLAYGWSQFKEVEFSEWTTAKYWNLYLAPHNYHWVHAACDGKNLKSFRQRGRKWPVNRFGRWLCPHLYVENDRLSYVWESQEFGRVAMICVGAMGVSSLRPIVAEAPTVKKAQKLLAFELGSTVLLVIERPPASLNSVSVLKVGDVL